MIPYATVESIIASSERTIRRLFIIIVLLAVLLGVSNAWHMKNKVETNAENKCRCIEVTDRSGDR